MKRVSINWPLWRFLWRFKIFPYLISISTPWFLIGLSSGDRDVFTGQRWYGIRAYWNPHPGWRCPPGEILFRSRDEFLSWTERTTNGGGVQ